MNHRASFLALAAGVTALISPVSAHEEPFGYLRGAQSEPKGEWEVNQWTTARFGKESGRYLGMDFATELEYGVTDRFQAALYLTGNYHRLRNSSGSSDTFDDRNRFGVSGTSLEMKYQLADPYRQWAGFALYFEPGYSTIDAVSGERSQEVELELRLIGEKHFLDHRLIAVVNYILEPEFEHEPGHAWETNLGMEWSAGRAPDLLCRPDPALLGQPLFRHADGAPAAARMAEQPRHGGSASGRIGEAGTPAEARHRVLIPARNAAGQPRLPPLGWTA